MFTKPDAKHVPSPFEGAYYVHVTLDDVTHLRFYRFKASAEAFAKTFFGCGVVPTIVVKEDSK